MAYIAINEDGMANIFVHKPIRSKNEFGDGIWSCEKFDMTLQQCAISPHAARRLTGKHLTWANEPFEI